MVLVTASCVMLQISIHSSSGSLSTISNILNLLLALLCNLNCTDSLLACCLLAMSFLTLCDPMASSLPGSSFHGILQARILEWDAISPGEVPDPEIKPRSAALVGGFFTI